MAKGGLKGLKLTLLCKAGICLFLIFLFFGVFLIALALLTTMPEPYFPVYIGALSICAGFAFLFGWWEEEEEVKV